jgi:hypothetical protein
MLVPPSAYLENNRNAADFYPIAQSTLVPFGVSCSPNPWTMRHHDALTSSLGQINSLFSIFVRHAYAHLSA